MPWSRRQLRNVKVFARVDAAGALVADERGLVAIKYKASDTRLYSARDKDLGVIAESADLQPDVSGEAPAARAAETKKAPSAKKSAAKGGARAASTSIDPRPGSVALYADGACTGNPGPAGAGAVLLYKGHRKEISQYLGLGTNNIAELTAILLGLEAIRQPEAPVDVLTDSAYSIGVLSKNWKPKANQDLIARIRHELRRFSDLRFVKVPGHSGVPENERADQLARDAITHSDRR